MAGNVDHLRYTYPIRTTRGLTWRRVQISALAIRAEARFLAVHDDHTDLALVQEALHNTSEQLLTARDEERQRITIELHELHQPAPGRHDPEPGATAASGDAQARLGTEIIDEIAGSLGELRRSRKPGRPGLPDGAARTGGQGGLSATIGKFLDGFAKRTGLVTELKAAQAVDAIAPAMQHAALRIVQEALLNANRHAQATRVSVDLNVDDGLLMMTIADDGCGMLSDPSPASVSAFPGCMPGRASSQATWPSSRTDPAPGSRRRCPWPEGGGGGGRGAHYPLFTPLLLQRSAQFDRVSGDLGQDRREAWRHGSYSSPNSTATSGPGDVESHQLAAVQKSPLTTEHRGDQCAARPC